MGYGRSSVSTEPSPTADSGAALMEWRLSYDPEVNALYLRLSDHSIKQTVCGDLVNVDLDADGAVVGVQILNGPVNQ